MQLEKVKRFMQRRGLRWITGPRVSYNYNPRTGNLVVITPRGHLTYNEYVEGDRYFREVLEYLVYGRLGKELRALVGVDDPEFFGKDGVFSGSKKKMRYDVMRIRGKKRSIYLVKHSLLDDYGAVVGDVTIIAFGDWLKVVKGENVIYSGEFDEKIAAAAVDGDFATIYSATTRVLDGKSVVELSIVRASVGRVIYNNKNKYYHTYFKREKDGKIVVDSVPYYEGVYMVIVPPDYEGPDPTAYYSVRSVPEEVELIPMRYYPVKLKWGTKLACHMDIPGVRFGRFKIFFSGVNDVKLQEGLKEFRSLDRKIAEELLSYGGNEVEAEFILSML